MIDALTAEVKAPVGQGTDDFVRAAACADRQLAAQCLFHVYSVFQIALDSHGNGVLLQPPLAGPEQGQLDGGELVRLLKLIKSLSDSLMLSSDPTDHNPLYELTHTLVCALLAALHPRSPRTDPDGIPFLAVGGVRPATTLHTTALSSISLQQQPASTGQFNRLLALLCTLRVRLFENISTPADHHIPFKNICQKFVDSHDWL
jgi:hypothetical protein